MASRADILAGSAFIRLWLQKADFITGLGEVSIKLSKFGTAMSLVGSISKAAAVQINKVTDAVATLGKRMAIVGAGLTGAILGTAKHFKDFGSTINDMSERTGIGTEALSQLAYAASQSGSSIEELETAIKHMQNRVAEKGIIGTKGLPGDQQLEVIADQIAAIEDPAERTAMAIDIFGRAGTRMMPMLIGGRAGLKAMRMEADALGLTMREKDAKAADALGDAWDRLKDAALGLAFNTGAALAEALTRILNTISSVIGAVSKWVSENRALVRVLVVATALSAAFGASLFVFSKVLGTFVKLLASVLAFAAVLKIVLKLLAFFGVSVPALLNPVTLAIGAIVAGLAVLASGALVVRFRRAVGQAAIFIFDMIKSLLERLPGLIARVAASARTFIASSLRDIRKAFEELWSIATKATKLFFELAKDMFAQLPAIAEYSAGLIVREFILAFNEIHKFIITSMGDALKFTARMIQELVNNPMSGPKVIAEMIASAISGQAARSGQFGKGFLGGKAPEFKISEGTQAAYQALLDQLGIHRGGGGTRSPGDRGMGAGSAFVTYSASALQASGRGSAIDRLVRINELVKELTKEGVGHQRDLKKEFKKVADGLRH